MKIFKRALSLLLAGICLYSLCGASGIIQVPAFASETGSTAETSAAAESASDSAQTLSYDATQIPNWPSGPSLKGEAGVLIDARTGTVLYGQNADEKLYPASITKLMTALLTLENANLNDVVTFSHAAIYSIEADSSHIALVEGEQLTVEQCLYALLLKSANEVANGLAEHVAGSMDAFAEMMNNRARQLGCENTHFVNANGLHDENHYTTCSDMAKIMRALITNETFLQISSARKYTIPPTNMNSEPRYLTQMHKMMCESDYTYEGTLAGKTGFTPEAGNTLVTYAVRGNVELIAVSMKTNWTHYDDTIAMMDFGFNNFTAVNLSDNDALNLDPAALFSDAQTAFDTSAVSIKLSDDNFALLPNFLTPADLTCSLNLNAQSDSDTIAGIEYSYDGVCLGSGTLQIEDSSGKLFDFKEHETAGTEGNTGTRPEGAKPKGAFFINIKVVLTIAVSAILLFIIVMILHKRGRKRRSVIRVRNSRREIRKRRRRQKKMFKDDFLD